MTRNVPSIRDRDRCQKCGAVVNGAMTNAHAAKKLTWVPVDKYGTAEEWKTMSKTVQMLAPGDGTYRGSDGREYTAERFGQRATIHADDVAKMEEFGWQRADDNKAMYPALEKAALGMAFSHASGGGNMPNIPARDDMRKRDFLSPAASAGYTTGTGHPVASNRRHELGEVEIDRGSASCSRCSRSRTRRTARPRRHLRHHQDRPHPDAFIRGDRRRAESDARTGRGRPLARGSRRDPRSHSSPP